MRLSPASLGPVILFWKSAMLQQCCIHALCLRSMACHAFVAASPAIAEGLHCSAPPAHATGLQLLQRGIGARPSPTSSEMNHGKAPQRKEACLVPSTQSHELMASLRWLTPLHLATPAQSSCEHHQGERRMQAATAALQDRQLAGRGQGARSADDPSFHKRLCKQPLQALPTNASAHFPGAQRRPAPASLPASLRAHSSHSAPPLPAPLSLQASGPLGRLTLVLLPRGRRRLLLLVLLHPELRSCATASCARPPSLGARIRRTRKGNHAMLASP